MCVCSRKNDQVGRALLWLPWYIVNQMIKAVESAEERVKGPPSIFEIFVEMKQKFNLPVNNIYEGAAVLTSLFREDMLYMNQIATHYSTQKHDGFKNFT
jgi:hypothetical protein